MKFKSYKCYSCGNDFEMSCSKGFKPKKQDLICLKCEKGVPPHGHIKKALNDYHKLGDFALAKRDSFSLMEKQSKDEEYANSSTLAAKKLNDDRSGYDGSFLGASPQKLKELGTASPEKLQKYVATGEL